MLYMFSIFAHQPNTKRFLNAYMFVFAHSKKRTLEDLKTVEPICQVFV